MANKTQNKAHKATTTVSTTVETRELLKNLARHKGLSMTQYIESLVNEASRCERRGEAMKARLNTDDLHIDELIVKMSNEVEALTKKKADREVFVSFIRQQEKKILMPLKNEVDIISTKFDALLAAIESLKNKNER